MTYEEMKEKISTDPEGFKITVKESLVKHVNVINQLSDKGMYFRIMGMHFYWKPVEQENIYSKETSSGFRYPSYVEDIMGPICFDYGFGPFNGFVLPSNEDLIVTDSIASVLRKLAEEAPAEIKGNIMII